MRTARSIIPALALLLAAAGAQACSVFSAQGAGGLLLARNFDWHDGRGYLLYGPAGQRRAADSGFAWSARYATLTWHLDAQRRTEYSIGGMNEKGLAIEAVWLKETEHGQAAGALLNETEWITYNLDSYASVREVLASAPFNRIRQAAEPLHYFGCDRYECFALEYLRGELTVFSGTDLPYAALTNVPYKRAVDALPSFQGFGGDRPAEGSSPLPRFVRAARALAEGSAATAAGAFSALASLKIPAGQAATKWTYLYTPARGEIIMEDGRRASLPELLAGPGRDEPSKVFLLP